MGILCSIRYKKRVYKKFIVQFKRMYDIMQELLGDMPDNPCYGMWLSLVERFVRDEEVAGSNPVIPILKPIENTGFFEKLKNSALRKRCCFSLFG